MPWFDPQDTALYFIKTINSHYWGCSGIQGAAPFNWRKSMRIMIRSPTDDQGRKKQNPEDFTNKDYERRSQNRSKTSRQKAACFSFGFCRKTEYQQKTSNLRFWLQIPRSSVNTKTDRRNRMNAGLFELFTVLKLNNKQYKSARFVGKTEGSFVGGVLFIVGC